MALNNIIAPRQTVVNSQGAPLAGGFVYLYEPGTTNFITSYTSADLVTPHQNPVRLSGSGRANIWITRNCDMLITDRIGNQVLTEDDANPDNLGGDTSSLVPNGSFEIVTTPPVPDGWTPVDDIGSTNAVDSTFSTDGANSYRFTSAGSGGGSLTTTDFFPVNDVDQLRVNFDLFSTLATVRNIVRIEWYDVTFVLISNEDIYDSTANPISWMEFQLIGTPPALSRFAKLKLIGIDPSVLLAGSTYFDRISVFYPTVVSGIFDNITIQDNEIISTNLNGEIALKPDGDGPVNIFSTGSVDLVDVQNPLNISNLLDPATNPHIAFDAANIQRKTDATNTGVLFLNPLGGNVVAGPGSGSGSVLLRDSTFIRAATASGGVLQLRGDANANPVTPDVLTAAIQLMGADQLPYAQLGYAAGIDLGLVNLARGGTIDLVTELAGGGAEISAQTTTALLGGLFVNNLLTGVGLERALTVSDLGGPGGLLPAGTTTNASLRWSGAAWLEETTVRLTTAGEVLLTDLRPSSGTVIDLNGMDETNVGLRFNDGMRATFTDLANSNPIQFGNVGIGGGSGTLRFSAAGSFVLEVLQGNFGFRDSGLVNNAFFGHVSPQLQLSGTNLTIFKVVPSLMLSQAAAPPTGQSANMVLYQKDAVVDSDIQSYLVPGVGGIEHAIAYVNGKKFGNTSYNLNTAQNAERAINGTFYYDDGGGHTITLEPAASLRIPLQSTFTVLHAGSGTTTIAVGVGGVLFYMDPGVAVTNVGPSCTIAIGGYATIYRDTAANWFIMGAGITP